MDVNFNLSEAIDRLVDAENIDLEHERDVNNDDPEAILEVAVEAVADNSDAVRIPEVFAGYCSLLKHFDAIPSGVMTKLIDSVSSGMTTECDAAIADINSDSRETFDTHKKALEMFAFLLLWAVRVADKVKGGDGEEGISAAPAPRSRRGRGAKAGGSGRGGARAGAAKKTKTNEEWDWIGQIPQILGRISKIFARLSTQRLWTTTAERDKYIDCMTKPAYHISETEANMKVEDVRMAVFKVICFAVKHQGHAATAHILIMQRLQYYEHLAEPMAHCLHILAQEYDYSQLADEILREISQKDFTGQDSKQTKSFSRFLTKLAELQPRVVLRQMSLLVKHLDAETNNIRVAMVEVIGSLIKHLDETAEGGATDAEMDSKKAEKQIKGLFAMLEERMLDTASHVRTKVLNVLSTLCHLNRKHPRQRLSSTRVAIVALHDITPTTRKSAISLIMALIETHPWGAVHDGLLDLPFFEAEYENQNAQLKQLDAKVGNALDNINGVNENNEDSQTDRTGNSEGMDVDGDDVPTDEEKEDEEEENSMDVDGEEPASPRQKKTVKLKPRKSQINVESLNAEEVDATHQEMAQADKLRLTIKFFVDAISFIRQIESAAEIIGEILGSKKRPEVIEAIKFFEVAHAHEVSNAEDGIRKMIHLIWSKEAQDPNEKIRPCLIDCYRTIYFDLRVKEPRQKEISRIAKNMIERTYNATLAELTSLEELIRVMMLDEQIEPDVVDKLWQIFETGKLVPKEQRRGAIIILGMMALAKRTILSDHVENMLIVGLGALGKADLTLARYTCIALQRLNGSAKKVKGSLQDKTIRFPMDNQIFFKLRKAIERPCRSKDWFGLAEQIINTIYALGEHPDVLCNDIIKFLTVRAFTPRQPVPPAEKEPNPDPDAMEEDRPEDISREEQPPTQTQSENLGDSFELSQLLFVVGHVAIKHIAHLELVERELKRQKDEKQKASGAPANKDGEELDQVAGNAEDEIGEQIHEIREKEMLDENSLLGVYGPMLINICGSPQIYKNLILRAAATLSLSKFLCVSTQFCEDNFRLLFKILEKSKNASIRSNVVIGLGDVAVSFSSVIDENSNELYKGLSDEDPTVKKNTLMVLTHLILNGMVKVKGQLGEMAKCLQDEDPRISDLAKLFFDELSTKDNAIYNNLPDVISHLSTGEHAVDEAKFESTMKFIFTYIDKDKHADNMVEKLCQRFRQTDEELQWKYISYCLSLLPFKSDKSVKKLIEALPLYQDKLHVEGVHSRFAEILGKARQTKPGVPKDAAIMAELQEFEKTLEEHKSQGEADKALDARVGKKKAAAKKRATRKPAAKKKPVKVEQEEEDEEDD